MSKAAKISIFILIALLLLTFGLSILIFLDKRKTENRVFALQQDISAYQDRERKYIVDNKDLQQRVQKLEEAKKALKEQVSKFENVNIDELQGKLKQLTQERDQWQAKIDGVTQERDKVAAQLTETRKQLQEAKATTQTAMQQKTQQAQAPAEIPAPGQQLSGQQEGYWAGVLKERAQLSVKADDLSQQLSEANVKITEMKKKNADLQLELTDLQRTREQIEHEIKRGKDLADSLSLQLAQAQSDKDFLSGRIDKISRENESLRGQIRELTNTKLALEKSIVRMQEEKKGIEQRLNKTENVIQGRIDDIWQLKQSLDETLKDVEPGEKSEKDGKGGGIELSPIVVSPGGSKGEGEEDAAMMAPPPTPVEGTRKTFDANVVSVNDENNFVIINAGAADGLKLGDLLNVYRGSDFVAGLEVIQVRNDIAAADIKNRSDKIQVGDVVR